MAATETDELPIHGKLIAQKIIKSELQIESLIQGIKKCDKDKSEMAKLNFSARNSIQGIKSDLQVGFRPLFLSGRNTFFDFD